MKKFLMGAFVALAAFAFVSCSDSDPDPEVETVENVTFDPAAGEVAAGEPITLSTKTEGAAIYYQIVSGEATVSLAKDNYTGEGILTYDAENKPSITAAATIYALAVKNGETSDVTSAAYTIEVIPEDSIRTYGANLEEGQSETRTAFAVYNFKDLKKLAEIVNGGNALSGVTITQKANIIINENLLGENFEAPAEVEPAQPNPNYVVFDGIGYGKDSEGVGAVPFSGTYNGNGFYISGAYIYGAHQGLGFFGNTKGATITELYLIDSCVVNSNASGVTDGEDDDRFGGFIGVVDADTTINGGVFVGAVGSAEATARNDYTAEKPGKIEYAGGLVGRAANGTLTVENAMAFANLNGTDKPFVGKYGTVKVSGESCGLSLAGDFYTSEKDKTKLNIEIKNEIAAFMASAPAEMKSVADACLAFLDKVSLEEIKISLYIASINDAVTVEKEETAAGYKVTISYDSTTLPIAADDQGIVWAPFEIGFNSGVEGVTFVNGESAVLVTESDDFEPVDEENYPDLYNAEIPLGIEGLSYTFKKEGYLDTVITFVFEDAPVETIPADSIRNYVDGGTAYSVYNFKDLKKLASLVNGGKDLAGVTITQKADIIVNDGVLDADWNAPAETTAGEPNADFVVFDGIGNKDTSAYFKGTYDGKGYEISGVYIYGDHQGLGFFGCTDGATIKNVIIKDICVVNSNASGDADGHDDDRFGGLIGVTNGVTTIENCVFMGTVGSLEAKNRGGAYEHCAGIIGHSNKKASTVYNCVAVVNNIADSSKIVLGTYPEYVTLLQDTVTGEDQVPKYDDNGQPVYDDNGQPEYEIVQTEEQVDTVFGYTPAEYASDKANVDAKIAAVVEAAQAGRQ